ncbi:MAG: translation initiation factor IF-2, partial [Clostridia bacterium]|nr:translation initiation factor IF-2 [Clostridia bacterium]
MMIKYRVHEVAKDLGVPSKDVIALLKDYLGEEKKHMTALTDDELNIVLEYYTQKNQVKSFDAYFASKNEAETEENTKSSEKKEDKQETKKSDKETAQSKPKDEKSVSKKAAPKKDNLSENAKKSRETAPVKKPVHKQKPAVKKDEFKSKIILTGSKSVENNKIEEDETSEGVVINTRTENVNIDKYNEKYDRIASEKMRTDNTVGKQKIVQKSQQRNKFKSAKRETEAERLKRIAEERKAKPLTVLIPDEITVGELASRLKATAAEVIKKLMIMGTMASINDNIDFDTASLVAMEFHAKVEKEEVVTIEEMIIDDHEDEEKDLVTRAPVVVVMGHVDHGKTSLLDAIRHADVTSTEAGGITQHIGAYRIKINDRDITFLDTPGHEAFTTMRARGAQITDIAILVVAADDGIKPQTVEAINHAKAAGVSMVVAINKMDKEGANPERVLQQLTEYEILPEAWGGDTPCIEVSAKTKQGIEELLEMVLLVADVKELKSNPNRRAKGTVIEARLDKGRGPVATILVQNGTLNSGDIVVAGTAVGRVRAMTNDKGEKVKSAGPSVPVEITGLDTVPSGGDVVNAVSDEKLARQLVEQRRNSEKEALFNSQTKVTLDNLFDQMKLGDVK